MDKKITLKTTSKSTFRRSCSILALFVLLMIFGFTNIQAQTIKTVGTGTTADDDAPVDPFFNYNYSQIIYTKAAIDAGSGTINSGRKITAISFYYRNSGGTVSNFNGWKVFMKNSSKTTFSSTTNWESISGATTVFDGIVTFPAAGNWMTITLTTPFIWDGTSSIIVSIDENTAGYSNDANIWNTASNTNTVLYFRSDGTNPDPASPPTGTRSAARPNIRFTFANYSAEYTSMSTGSANWCVGESRTVSATIKNNGVNSWADGGGVDINVGVKWNYEGDYITRVDAASLASGSSTTYNLSMTAPSAGSENLTFNVVYEGVSWFGGEYSSTTQTITGPLITQTGTLSAFGACTSVASAEQSFTVSGSCLSGNITVSAPTGFEISTTSGSGFSSSSITLTQSGGVVNTTTIYVRMAALGSSPSASNVTCTSSGATTRNVAISGTVYNKPIMGTITVNGDSNPANTITLCPGNTLSVSQSGFNNYGGTTYFYSDNTTGFGGWAVAPDWEIISNGDITAANQVGGQTGVNNLGSFNYTINTPGNYILHTNAVNGVCYGDGYNRYITVSTPSGDQTSYGSGSWIGYVYNSATPGAFTAYTGTVTESETFNRSHTSASGATINHCSTKEDFFAIRYKMTKSFSAGYYTFSVGGDDGVRLSIDGGGTWLINNWVDQGYTVSTSSSVYLNGSVNLIFEYYENGGGAQSSFSYSCGTPATPSAITGNTTPCASTGGYTYSVTNVAGMTYNWTLPVGWSGTSTTNSITVTTGSSPGTISVTAQGGCSASSASSQAITFSNGPSNFSGGFDAAVCSGGNVSLNGSATYTATANTYVFANSTGASAQDMSGSSSLIGSSQDDIASAVTNIGFNFVYEGVNYTQFSVNSNGLIRLGGTAVSTDFTNAIADNSDNPKIMPLWDDISTGTSGYVNYKVNGTAPNRILVIEHYGRLDATEGSGSTSRFQTLFYETTNEIEFIYVSSSTSPASATIGIAGATFTNYLARNANTGNTFATSGAVNTVSSWPGNGVKYKFSPAITYSWSPATFLSATNIANPTASNITSSQTYTFTATSNGCSLSDQVVVSLRSIPAATAVNSGPICAGNTVDLTANNLAPSGQVVTMGNNGTDNISATTHSGVLNNHTMEFWVNPNRTVVLHGEQNTGVSGSLGAPTTEYSFAIAPNQFGGSGCTPANVGTGVSVGTNGIEVVQHGPCHFPVTLSYSGSISGWTHVAVVHISNVPYLYINGNLVKVGVSSVYPTFPNSSVSMNYGYFGGSIDNVRVWSVSRSANQIVTDMNLEVPSSATGLLQNLPLNGNGTALTGSSATITGSTYSTPTFYTYTWSGTSAPSASTTQTQATSALFTTGNYSVTATSAGCTGNASSNTAVTVNSPTTVVTPVANDYVWDGSSSNVWNLAANWLQYNGSVYTQPASFPNTNTDKVILPTTSQTCVVNAARIGAYTIDVNTLTIENGHTFQMNNAAGVLNVFEAITNNGTWSTPTAGSTVNYSKSGDQSIAAVTYSNLTTSGSGTKTLTGTTTLNRVLTIGNGTTFNLSNRTLRSVYTGGAPIVNNGTWTHATSTVDFRGAGNQTIPALTYNNLQTTTSGIKTLAGTTTATGVVTVGASTTLALGANTLNLAFVGTPLVTTGSLTIGTSTINYSGTGAQTVNGLAYHNLGITGTGAKTLSGAASVANTLALTNGILTVGANTFTMNGSTMTRTSGSIDASDAGSTLVFGNSSLLTLPASVFSADVNNLTLSNARVKATSDFTVKGVLNLNAANPDATNGLLDMVQSYGNYANVNSVNSTDSYNDLSSAVLTLASSATVTGAGEVTGKIRRTSFTDGVTYAFGNPNMQLTFDLNGGASLPTQITVVATKGTEGLHIDKDGTSDFTPGTADTLIGGAAVQRMYQILKTGGSSEVRFTVRFPYLDSELNGNTEADLVTWDHHLPYAGRTPHEHGKTNVDATNNWVELADHGIGYLATEGDVAFTKYWMLGENIIKVPTWLGAASGGATGDWNSASNWTNGIVPTSSMSVLIPDASGTPHDPDPTKLPSSISVGTLEIQSGGILDGGTSEITITGGPAINGGRGSWINNGNFIPSSSKVNFDYTDATISGTTTFNDIQVNTGKLVEIQANSNNSIKGTVTLDGTFDAATHENTIIFNGSGQSIPQFNGVTPGFYNLKINQSSGSAIAIADLTCVGNLEIENGTLNMDGTNNYNLTIGGDFINNGTLSNALNVYFNGANPQIIDGTTITTFENLLINGTSSTVSLNQDIIVNQVLNIANNNSFNGTDKEVELAGDGTPFVINGTFIPSTGTINYTSVDPTIILPITYFNLKSEGAVTKTLSGNTTVDNILSLDESKLDASTYTLTVGNNPIATNGGLLKVDAGNLEFTNTSDLTIQSGIIDGNTINDFTLSGIGAVNFSNDITLTGDLTLTNGNLNLGSTMMTMETNATMSRTNGLINTGTGGLIFKAANLDLSTLASSDINKIEINRSGGTVEMNNGNLNITSSFTLTAGTLDINSNELRFSGSIVHTAGAIDADAGTIDFNNSGAYTISNGLFAGDISGMKVSGLGGLTLSDPTIVTSLLTMNGGNITTSATDLLEIGKNVSTLGSITWTTGNVVGPMKRWFAASTNSTVESGIFPVGTSTLNRYAQINFTEAPEGGYLVMQFHTGAPAGLNYETDLPIMYMNSQGLRRYIQNADESGYWEMTPYNATGEAYEALDNFKYNLALRINNPTSVQNGGILNNPPGVKLIRAKGYADGSHGDWELAGTYSTFEELNAGADYVIKSVNVTGFSWFNGGGDNQNPLPIELLSFTGFCNNNQTTINWKTASEFNSSYFVVEKSTDGQNWREVNNQEAAGISTSELSYQFVDVSNNDDNAYYRLTQHDIDGEFTVYDPIFVSCNENGSFIKTYPNPSDNSFQVLVNNKALVGKATIQLIDTKGTLVSTKEIVVEDGTNLFYLNENMAPGIYYLSISNGTTSTEIVKHSVK